MDIAVCTTELEDVKMEQGQMEGFSAVLMASTLIHGFDSLSIYSRYICHTYQNVYLDATFSAVTVDH